jgi:hypothetical protein
MLRRFLWMAAAATLVMAHQTPVAIAEEEAEAPESAVSSPPMEMDDPGTPGRQGVEVNFVGSLVHVGPGRSAETLLDANYGIGDRIQLKYERPYVSEGAVGEHAQRGLGATEFGIKWRAVDHGGLAMAFYPQYQMDDAFKLKDENGDAEESEGRSVYFPVLVSKEVHHLYTVGANLGYRRNLDGRGDDANLALGAGRAFGEYTRVLTEVYSERDNHLHNRQTNVRVGYVFALFPKSMEQSHFEIPAYLSVGHSVGATEVHERSTSIVFGMSLIVKPKG